jgi:hypothetical protein
LRSKEDFFFEKKKQKTFTPWSRASPTGPAPNEQKFFGSFFLKKNCLLSLSAKEPDPAKRPSPA